MNYKLNSALFDNYQGGSKAIFLEGGILPNAWLVLLLELLKKVLPQDAFSLAMDKDNLGAGSLAVSIHGFLKGLHLDLQHFLVAQTGSVVQKGFYVKVYLNDAFLDEAMTSQGFLYFLHTGRLLRLVVLFQKGILKVLCLDKDLMGRLVVLDHIVDQGRVLKENRLLEGVELVELDGVNADLDIHGRLKQVILLFLIGHELDSHTLNLVQV